MARQSLILGLAALIFGVGPFLLNSTAQQRCPGTLNVNFRMQQQTSRLYQQQQRQIQLQFQQQQTQRLQEMQRQYTRTITNVPQPIARNTTTIVPQRTPAKTFTRQPTPISITNTRVFTQQPRLNLTTGIGQARIVTPKTKVVTSTTLHRPLPIKHTIPQQTTQNIVQRKATSVQPKRHWVLETQIPVKTIVKERNPLTMAKITTTPGNSHTVTRTSMSMTMDFKCFQCHRQNNILTRQPTQNPMLVVRQQTNLITRPSVPIAIIQPRLPARTPIVPVAGRVELPAPVAKLGRPAIPVKLPADLIKPLEEMPPRLVLLDPISKGEPAKIPQTSSVPLRRALVLLETRPESSAADLDGPAQAPLAVGTVVLATSGPSSDETPPRGAVQLASNVSATPNLTTPGLAPLSSRPFLPLLSK